MPFDTPAPTASPYAIWQAKATAAAYAAAEGDPDAWTDCDYCERSFPFAVLEVAKNRWGGRVHACQGCAFERGL